jgi:hypothetical protein
MPMAVRTPSGRPTLAVAQQPPTFYSHQQDQATAAISIQSTADVFPKHPAAR